MNKCIDRGVLTLAAIIIGGLVLSTGCAGPGGEGFAIYLTRDEIPPDRMEALSHVEIASQPVISANDIIAYNAQTHEIGLTPGAFERVTRLDVPVRGRSFVVCVDRRPVYWGAFWTPFSSVSFDGVTIPKPLSALERETVTLELGYPSPSFYSGEDPRNDAKVMKSLKQAGKLVDRSPSSGDGGRLPHSFKGYELYSWLEGGEWQFTLITGTNRTKTMAEIVSGEGYVSETEGSSIRVAGEGEIKSVLSRVPPGESVVWCDELHIGQTAETDLQLPPPLTVYAIQEHARRCGLDFAVAVE